MEGGAGAGASAAAAAAGAAEVSLGFYEHMAAGAAAGVAEHVTMFPLDTIKTRMQVLAVGGELAGAGCCAAAARNAPVHATVWRALECVVKREGVAGLYRGCSAMGLGAGPAHALYFATYEVAKASLGGGGGQGSKAAPPSALATGASGACATVVGDAIITPLDTVKQRMQVEGSPYRDIGAAVRGTYAKEGLGAFFRSYRTTLIMNVPFTAVHFAAYESAKHALRTADDDTVFTQAVAGGAAGGLAAAATNPLDVVKTRLQTSTRYREAGEGITGVARTLRRIVAEEGYGALLHGVRPRVLFHVPAAAICWTTYESCKAALRTMKGDDG